MTMTQCVESGKGSERQQNPPITRSCGIDASERTLFGENYCIFRMPSNFYFLSTVSKFLQP